MTEARIKYESFPWSYDMWATAISWDMRATAISWRGNREGIQVHGDNVMWNCLETEMKVEDIWPVLKYNFFFSVIS